MGLTARLSALLVLIVAGSVPLQATRGAGPEAESFDEKIASASRTAERGDCKPAFALVPTQAPAASFTALPQESQIAAFELAASCAQVTKQDDTAYRYALQATQLGYPSDWLWYYRLAHELSEKRLEAAVTSMELMAKGHGKEVLNAAPARWFFFLMDQFEETKHRDLRRRFLAVLSSDAFEPKASPGIVDYFRQQHAELSLDLGDRAGAAALVRTIRSPDVLRGMMFDPRFQPMLPAGLDLRTATEQHLGRLRDAAARNPHYLGPIIEISTELRRLGLPDEALALLTTSDPALREEGAYADLDEHRNWWWDAVARTQVMRGEYGFAVKALEQGKSLTENGQVNVSQTINLAAVQLRFDHPKDALATIARLEQPRVPLSPYGELQKRGVRGCAAALTGQPELAKAELDFIRKHEADAPGSTADMLMCLGDLDGAAGEFIRQLNDPKQRTTILIYLSDFDPPVVPLPPGPSNANMPALKARPDIQAAIKRAGGTAKFRLQRDNLS